ncbi:helix-turn-helix domain-containing protein [Methylobacterium aerolatum]|uniref:Transcriptional regulator with XRE-family HTH domain n=1 Tax=Methylobacterium aerolatum TaxID=418708 RepID=A0ABU0HUM7_9HYPH|nr:helix-turn-helix transcriptional regulator [Methylobacterium aerolatum]MDQ0446034.1 transcriptional regulator with XRE-family HTH domain [Methylobacterium aerolatum]GJD35070.1 hypothetical protein FMGBMHLM_1977 [Methylobacterium aerolatum]
MSDDVRDQGRRSTAATLKRRQAGPIDRYVGTRITAERQLRGMSSFDLGRRLGFTVVQMKKYERGQSRIPVGTLCAVSEILDVPLTRFLPVERGPLRQAAACREEITRTLLQMPDVECLASLSDLLTILVRYRTSVN